MVESLAPERAPRSGRRTPDRILDAAMVEFGTRGYEATSLDDLAGILGIRKQTILYYFASKELLLEAVVDEAGAELSGVLEAAVSPNEGARLPGWGGPGWGQVEAIVRSVFRLAGRRPGGAYSIGDPGEYESRTGRGRSG